MEDIILVSMPTYHGPLTWVKRAINSLQNQTYSNFECWIVKDGCQDGCRWADAQSHIASCLMCNDCKNRMEYLRNFSEGDTRFKVFDLPINFGSAGWGPRNFIFLNTNHTYIAYLDDDNWYEPNHLEVLYKTIISGDKDFVFTGTNLYNLAGEKIGERMNKNTPTYCYIDTSEIMHNRRIINEVGWRGMASYGDWDLVERWLNKRANWSHTNQFTLNYMQRGVPGGAPRESAFYIKPTI